MNASPPAQSWHRSFRSGFLAASRISAVVNIVVDDGEARARCVLFGELVSKLLSKPLPDIAAALKTGQYPLTSARSDLISRNIIFSGSARMSKFDNKMEILLDSFVLEEPLDTASQELSEIEQRFTSSAS